MLSALIELLGIRCKIIWPSIIGVGRHCASTTPAGMETYSMMEEG
jgi:hypothetical protein